MSQCVHVGMVGRERVRDERWGFSTDPTRIYRMPEDQVAKRGTTVQLECRVKHDPSLKLTVSWMKDDEPLYIGNRSPLHLVSVWSSFGFLFFFLAQHIEEPRDRKPGSCVSWDRSCGGAQDGLSDTLQLRRDPTLHPSPFLPSALCFSSFSLSSPFLSSLLSSHSLSLPSPLIVRPLFLLFPIRARSRAPPSALPATPLLSSRGQGGLSQQ